MDKFYEKLNISENCLANQTIFKKTFLESVDLLASDKKLINDHIKKVIWKYCLKPDNTNIPVYKDDEREYYEIEIIEVQLNETNKVKRIAEIIMRAIPYPILLVFINDNQIQLVTGDMRKSLSDNSKVTVDNFVYTDWFEIESGNPFVEKLLAELNFKQLNFTNFYLMYRDLEAKLNNFNIAKLKDTVEVPAPSNVSDTDRKNFYDEIKSIDIKIESIQKQLKKNSPLNEKVEASVKIKALKDRKEQLLKLL